MNLTLVWNKHWEYVQEVQFGLDKLASGTALAKRIGSVFSRQCDATNSTLLSEKCGLSVREVPPWLQHFQLSRMPVLRRDEMRIINNPELIQDVVVGELEGFLVVIVICTRYTEPEESALDMVRSPLFASTERRLGIFITLLGRRCEDRTIKILKRMTMKRRVAPPIQKKRYGSSISLTSCNPAVFLQRNGSFLY